MTGLRNMGSVEKASRNMHTLVPNRENKTPWEQIAARLRQPHHFWHEDLIHKPYGREALNRCMRTPGGKSTWREMGKERENRWGH